MTKNLCNMMCSLSFARGSLRQDNYQERPGDEERPPPYDEDSRDEKPHGDNYDDDDVVLTIHPVKSKNGVLVDIQPPTKPRGPPIDHVPCDIVLVIDVSGSMNSPAPAPMNDDNGNAVREDYGLTSESKAIVSFLVLLARISRLQPPLETAF
jgi:hypothetical protein